MYWCCTASKGKAYNTLLYKSDDPHADYSGDIHLIDDPARYSYLLDLGYNASGAPNVGSAVFLCCWEDPETATEGSVAVSMGDLVAILQMITPGTAVTVY